MQQGGFYCTHRWGDFPSVGWWLASQVLQEENWQQQSRQNLRRPGILPVCQGEMLVSKAVFVKACCDFSKGLVYGKRLV